MSRTHLLVEVQLPAIRLRDLGSKHATWLNGRKITTGEALEGDVIQIGDTKLLMSVNASYSPDMMEESDVFAPISPTP